MKRMRKGLTLALRCAVVGLVAVGLSRAQPPAAAVAVSVEAGQVYCHGATVGPHYYHSGVAMVRINLPADHWWPTGRAERLARRGALARLAGEFARRVGEGHGVDVLLSPRCDWSASEGNQSEDLAAGVATGAAAARETAAYARSGVLVAYGPGEKTVVDWVPDFKDVFREEVEATSGGSGAGAAGVGPGAARNAAVRTGAGGASGVAAVAQTAESEQLLRIPPGMRGVGALHAAAAAGDIAAAAAEIAAGTDPRARDAVGNSALDVAAAAGAAGVIGILVANGVEPGVLDRSLRDRPLHWAARAGAADAAAVLLAHGAPAGVGNASGETALHAAAAADAVGVVAILLAHGADPLAQDRLGRTPRDVAVAAGSSSTAAALLLAGP